jgi:FkbM family methyltransferase
MIKRFSQEKLKQLIDTWNNKNHVYPIKHYAYHQLSFSQEGEDIILARIFDRKDNGFYVDIGAHHPQRFSNTYYFYLRGWRGINIDPLPFSMDEFERLRPLDINLELAVASSDEKLIYYQFNEPALNGFSEEISRQRDGIRGDYFITGTQEIQTHRLSEILDQYLPSGQVVDFMTIDVEGLDLEVLKSNDWSRFRPKVVLVEELNKLTLDKISESPIFQFMKNQGYTLYAKTVNTLFFKCTT